MVYRLPPLNWLRAFEAAARHLSFTAAAKELNLTPAAISHQVRSLEGQLGFPLFERLPRSLKLTNMASAYLPSVRKAFSELSMSTSGLFGGSGKQVVTVRCAASLSVLWLAPRLNAFLELYPDLDVRIYSAIWAESLEAEKVDIDIRYGDGRWSDGQAELLLNEEVIPVCSRALLNRDGPIRNVADFADQKLIHIMGVQDSWELLLRDHGVQRPHPRQSIQVDYSVNALELAAQGGGHCLVFESFAQPYLDQKRLIRPLDVAMRTDQSHYLIFPDRDEAQRPEVVMFREWLMTQTARHADQSPTASIS